MFSSNTSQVSGGYEIQRSLRFNSADSAYLNRTPASAGNRRTFTFSAWVKRSFVGTGADNSLINGYVDNNNRCDITFAFDANAQLYFYNRTGGTDTAAVRTSAIFRDPSAWYHIVFAIDTTQSTSTNRVAIYVNGVAQALSGTYPSLNEQVIFNYGIQHTLGVAGFSGLTNYFSGYMTEVNFIDGQALTPSSFGAFDAQTGVWGPTRYGGSYGTNGFYLNFSDNSNTTAATLGKDYSGNGNNWTPNNFSVSAGAGNDSLVDVPTNWGTDTGVGGSVRGNYATWNPLVVNRPTLTNGNLDADGSDLKTAISTMGVSTGRWYWEILIRNGTDTPNMGVTSFPNDNADPGVYLGAGRSYVSSGGGGGIYKNYTSTSTVADSDFSNANTAGAIIGFALDCDAGTLSYYVNNVLGHTDTTIATGTLLYPMTCNFNSAANAYRNTSVNFGQRPFAYTAPSGFRALNTQNLPTPTIGATTATQAGKFFNPVLYTGNGSTQSITGVGFQPDFTWIKDRTAAEWHRLYDAVRGATKELYSNTTNAEGTDANGLSAFNSDGFSVGTLNAVNKSADAFVAWNWKANGAGVTNTAGSITSTVSANTTSGFSVVTFSLGATGSRTVGHGLGVAPRMIIIKNRTGPASFPAWYVYHASIGNGNYLTLNTTGASVSSSTVWDNTSPTSSVFTLGASWTSGNFGPDQVAYCFAEVPGYSRFGSYTGNGSADGPFVFCGFRPAYVMIKASSDGSFPWLVFDRTRNPSNVVSQLLLPNASDSEYTVSALDFTANGFKLRDTNTSRNNTGTTYIFAAFAEAPQKFALAR